MRKSTLVGGLAAALASMVLVLPPPASTQAAGQGGGTGDVYADLFVAYRDVDGVPILSETFYEEGPVAVNCIQPISYTPIPGVTSTTNPADGRTVYLVPLVGYDFRDLTPPLALADTACLPQTAFSDYASEVDLERLNLVRTSDAVLWKKLADVGARLAGATKITLDGAGRITTDGVAIDASPDQAAIYAAEEGPDPAPPQPTDGRPGAAEPGGLMDTGTIPHWLPDATDPVTRLGDPAKIVQGSGSFDNWMLAASAIGTATSKGVPVTIDTVQYYNRIAAPGGLVAGWDYVSTSTPDFILDQEANGEQFVDYRDFEYTRSNVFKGCTTWLDVSTLTWKTDTVINRVDFGALPPVADSETGMVSNVAGFAQMADDVRSVINYLHNNAVVVDPDTGAGFFIDPVFTQTCDKQKEDVATLNKNVDLARLMVKITSGPEDGTTDTLATFEFKPVISSVWIGPDVDVFCELDGLGAAWCESPKTYSDLTVGEHTFTAYATDGKTAGLLTVYKWTVVAPDLTVTITKKPAELTYDTSATFEFEAVEPGVHFVCTLDEGEETTCESGETYSDLGEGEHTFTVYATDSVTKGLPTTYTWEVLATDLMVRITSAPADVTYLTSATFVFEADEAGVDFVCELDGELFDSCESGDTYLTPAGDHTFTVYATVGDTKGLPTDRTWTVLSTGGSTGGSSGGSSGGSTGETTVVTPTPTPPSVAPPGEGFDVVSLNPARLADTRPGWVAADGLFTGTGPVSGGQFVQVPVAGRGGVPVGAKGAVVNVTIVDPVAGGFATVYPCGTVPFTSSLNYSAGENVANEVFAKLSATGTICVYTSATANVIVDVAGFVPAGSDVVSLNPARLADTRPGWVAADGLFEGTGAVSGGQFVQVPVAGRGGVPVGAKGAVVNVTLVGPAADGFATVYPCGTVPFTSSLNYSAGENVANEVFAKLSSTGTICVYTSATANVIVDVAGYVPAGSDVVSLNPARLADTRPGWVAADGLFEGTGAVSGGQFVQVPVAGRGGVPVGAKSVVANVTIADPVAGGFATVYPCGTVPFTSSLNYSAGENVANEVFAKLSSTGTICVYTSATANVIVDVAGYM